MEWPSSTRQSQPRSAIESTVSPWALAILRMVCTRVALVSTIPRGTIHVWNPSRWMLGGHQIQFLSELKVTTSWGIFFLTHITTTHARRSRQTGREKRTNLPIVFTTGAQTTYLIFTLPAKSEFRSQKRKSAQGTDLIDIRRDWFKEKTPSKASMNDPIMIQKIIQRYLLYRNCLPVRLLLYYSPTSFPVR